MRLALAAALVALAGVATPAAADPSSEAARSCAVRGAAEPATLKAGATGKLTLVIEPSGAVHVDPKAPLKVTLSATPGLALPRAQLGRADSAATGAGVTLSAPFTATTAGAQEVRAKVDFFLCTDQWCVKQVRDVTVTVDVK
jgi:hypothetical protein